MKITIVEVAKACNVSVATVSRVLNGNYPVKESTRKKVLQVIKELNYTPNTQARDLSKQNSSTIGVVVPSISNMYFTQVIKGIEKYYEESQFSIFLCTTDNDKEKEKARVNELISRNVAGIIIVDPNIENYKNNFYEQISKSTPVVFVNGYPEDKNISVVCSNQKEGSNLAMNYLLQSNKDIAFIRGSKSYSYDIKEEVYKDIMKKNDNYDENYIVNIGYGNSIETVDKTMELTLDLLEKYNDISAVFACNDLMAIGVMNACKKLNKNIPKDISIVGYDNIALSQMVEPKLTTIDQNMILLGKSAGVLLNEKIENHNTQSRKIILKNTLVQRST